MKIDTLEFLRKFFKEASTISIYGLKEKGDFVTLKFQMNYSDLEKWKVEIELEKKFFIKHSKELFSIVPLTGSPYKPLRDNEKGFPKLDNQLS